MRGDGPRETRADSRLDVFGTGLRFETVQEGEIGSRRRREAGKRTGADTLGIDFWQVGYKSEGDLFDYVSREFSFKDGMDREGRISADTTRLSLFLSFFDAIQAGVPHQKMIIEVKL